MTNINHNILYIKKNEISPSLLCQKMCFPEFFIFNWNHNFHWKYYDFIKIKSIWFSQIVPCLVYEIWLTYPEVYKYIFLIYLINSVNYSNTITPKLLKSNIVINTCVSKKFNTLVKWSSYVMTTNWNSNT